MRYRHIRITCRFWLIISSPWSKWCRIMIIRLRNSINLQKNKIRLRIKSGVTLKRIVLKSCKQRMKRKKKNKLKLCLSIENRSKIIKLLHSLFSWENLYIKLKFQTKIIMLLMLKKCKICIKFSLNDKRNKLWKFLITLRRH